MNDEPKTWFYYLHTNGDLIGKNPFVVNPEYFDSPFVKKYWRIDLTNRADLYRLLLEALALGARIDRAEELARQWGCDFDDTIEMFKHQKNPSELMINGLNIFIEQILEMKVEEFWKKAKERWKMKKPICVKCETEFRMKTAGVVVKEMFQNNEQIYKIWYADLWDCPSCHSEIIFGFSEQPAVIHHEKERMEEVLKEIAPKEDEGLVFLNKEYRG